MRITLSESGRLSTGQAQLPASLVLIGPVLDAPAIWEFFYRRVAGRRVVPAGGAYGEGFNAYKPGFNKYLPPRLSRLWTRYDGLSRTGDSGRMNSAAQFNHAAVRAFAPDDCTMLVDDGGEAIFHFNEDFARNSCDDRYLHA
jgi:hypothetical protein